MRRVALAARARHNRHVTEDLLDKAKAKMKIIELVVFNFPAKHPVQKLIWPELLKHYLMIVIIIFSL